MYGEYAFYWVMLMRKMIIVQSLNGFFPLDCTYVKIRNIYKSEELISRLARKIILKMSLPFEKAIFGDWTRDIIDVDEVIVFDTGNAKEIVRFLNKEYPSKRVIMWYWNSVKDSVLPEEFKKLNVELWTFDPADAKRYNMRLNTQFFIADNLKVDPTQIIGSEDVFYVGADKDRAKYLAEMEPYFKKFGVTYNYNLVQYRGSTNAYNIEYKHQLTYKEVVQHSMASKALIDLVAEWQTGLTLRPLEALVLKKKLITNMRSIVNEPFYNKNNIFVLGVDDLDSICDFINNPYDLSNHDKYTNYYSFSSWLDRF